MSGGIDVGAPDAAAERVAFVVAKMKAGVASSTIVQDLAGQGMDQPAALELVGRVHLDLQRLAEAERFTLGLLAWGVGIQPKA